MIANISTLKEYEIITLIYNIKTWRLDIFFFFNVSDHNSCENDQNETKLHSEYDYESIRNSLSTFLVSRHWTFWYHQLSTARGGGGEFIFFLAGGGTIYTCKLLKLFTSKQPSVVFVFLMIYTYKLFKAFPPYFTGWSLTFVSKALTECILNLLEPSTAWGEGGTIITYFFDLVSTNILLAMLGFPLSQKRHADFCFKPSGLFLL